MSQGWTFVSNPFESGTRRNYSRAGKLGRYTTDQLTAQAASDPVLQQLHDTFQPLNAAYQQAMTAWLAAGGTKEGATLSLRQLEEAINNEVKDWEQSIKNTFMPGTPGYEAIFPHGITHLKKGKRQDRIDRLGALVVALTGNPEFTPIKEEVSARIQQLEATATDQGGKKGLTKTKSELVEEARVAMCIGLYAVLGGLMQRYAATPERIAPFFDLSTLRDTEQRDFTGPVAAGATRNIAQRSLLPADAVILTNNGAAALTFFFGATAAAAYNPAAPSVTVAPGDSSSIPASSLGNVPADAFLMVMNAGGVAGHWVVEL